MFSVALCPARLHFAFGSIDPRWLFRPLFAWQFLVIAARLLGGVAVPLKGQIQATVWFVSAPCLFLWTLVLLRGARPLAWLGWASVLAMTLLGLWLPAIYVCHTHSEPSGAPPVQATPTGFRNRIGGASFSFHKPENAIVDYQTLTRFRFVVTMRTDFLGLETIHRTLPSGVHTEDTEGGENGKWEMADGRFATHLRWGNISGNKKGNSCIALA